MRIAICDDDRVFIDEAKAQIEKSLSLSAASSQFCCLTTAVI